MAQGIYKLTTHARFVGQAVVSSFWYKSVLEGDVITDVLIDAAEALGRSFLTHVWGTHWRNAMPTTYYMDGVSVMGYNDQYELLYNNTIQMVPIDAHKTGAQEAGERFLPLGNVANLAFQMANRPIALPWFPPPKKGLVAISPIAESWAGNDGTLNDTGSEWLDPLAADFAAKLPWDFVDVDIPFTNWNVGVGIPFAFWPLRAKTWQWDAPQIFGGITYAKHIEVTDVRGCVVRKKLGFRRSRMTEG